MEDEVYKETFFPYVLTTEYRVILCVPLTLIDKNGVKRSG